MYLHQPFKLEGRAEKCYGPHHVINHPFCEFFQPVNGATAATIMNQAFQRTAVNLQTVGISMQFGERFIRRFLR